MPPDDDQPAIPSKPPADSGAASQPGSWQALTVEQVQAVLPQYEIIAMLGRGGMGAVYKGRQEALDRFVAIKVLPPGVEDEVALETTNLLLLPLFGQLTAPLAVA